MESPRAFLLELDGEEGCGVCDRLVREDLPDTDDKGRGIEGASAAPLLSPMRGIVGLSGRGVLLHLLPSL